MGKINEAKLLGMLGLAARARKLVTGTELVTEAVRKSASRSANHRSKAAAVLIADDAADNTKKRITDCCRYYGIGFTILPVSKDALSHAIGKQSDVAVCGVFDAGFAAAIQAITEGSDSQKAPITKERKVSETESDAEGIAYDHK